MRLLYYYSVLASLAVSVSSVVLPEEPGETSPAVQQPPKPKLRAIQRRLGPCDSPEKRARNPNCGGDDENGNNSNDSTEVRNNQGSNRQNSIEINSGNSNKDNSPSMDSIKLEFGDNNQFGMNQNGNQNMGRVRSGFGHYNQMQQLPPNAYRNNRNNPNNPGSQMLRGNNRQQPVVPRRNSRQENALEQQRLRKADNYGYIDATELRRKINAKKQALKAGDHANADYWEREIKKTMKVMDQKYKVVDDSNQRDKPKAPPRSQQERPRPPPPARKDSKPLMMRKDSQPHNDQLAARQHPQKKKERSKLQKLNQLFGRGDNEEKKQKQAEKARKKRLKKERDDIKKKLPKDSVSVKEIAFLEWSLGKVKRVKNNEETIAAINERMTEVYKKAPKRIQQEKMKKDFDFWGVDMKKLDAANEKLKDAWDSYEWGFKNGLGNDIQAVRDAEDKLDKEFKNAKTDLQLKKLKRNSIELVEQVAKDVGLERQISNAIGPALDQLNLKRKVDVNGNDIQPGAAREVPPGVNYGQDSNEEAYGQDNNAKKDSDDGNGGDDKNSNDENGNTPGGDNQDIQNDINDNPKETAGGDADGEQGGENYKISSSDDNNNDQQEGQNYQPQNDNPVSDSDDPDGDMETIGLKDVSDEDVVANAADNNGEV